MPSSRPLSTFRTNNDSILWHSCSPNSPAFPIYYPVVAEIAQVLPELTEIAGRESFARWKIFNTWNTFVSQRVGLLGLVSEYVPLKACDDLTCDMIKESTFFQTLQKRLLLLEAVSDR
ncbi:hypothetical protein C8R44DRAFT_894824 [Mycena epipterygia]|nr:hypothetical protein C8R44DRAFT_894824 [Mycena epipterygia]